MGVDALSGAAVFLDRDGVLNRAVVIDGVPRPPVGVDELHILPGAPEACRALREAGFVTVIVTNQPDVSRGTASRADVERLNRAVALRTGVDDIRVCPHDDRDGCRCRKPAPGMLVDAAASRSLDLSRSYMVGDRWRDIEAGRRAGCRSVLIDRRYPEGRGAAEPEAVVADLGEAVRWILADSRQPGRI